MCDVIKMAEATRSLEKTSNSFASLDLRSSIPPYHHTTRVCQATLRPGSVLAGPRRADEGHGSPTAEGRTRERSPTAPCRPQVGNRMKMRTGRRPMLPLASSPACSPAENLQISRVQPPFAFNTKKTRDRKTSSWRLGSWNVRSLLDAEGPVETAMQSNLSNRTR